MKSPGAFLKSLPKEIPNDALESPLADHLLKRHAGSSRVEDPPAEYITDDDSNDSTAVTANASKSGESAEVRKQPDTGDTVAWSLPQVNAASYQKERGVASRRGRGKGPANKGATRGKGEGRGRGRGRGKGQRGGRGKKEAASSETQATLSQFVLTSAETAPGNSSPTLVVSDSDEACEEQTENNVTTYTAFLKEHASGNCVCTCNTVHYETTWIFHFMLIVN